jgi:spectinomycin phosphotransferase
MDHLFSVLIMQYALEPKRISPIKGGWSALAYKVECGEQCYFLKAYEKKNAATAYWTALLDDYMPILVWLSSESLLCGRVPNPVLTRNGGFKCQDDSHIFVLYDFIEGETVGERLLTHQRVLELAQIMADLHASGAAMPFHTKALEEDYLVPFLIKLEAFLDRDLVNSPSDLRDIALPYQAQLKDKAVELSGLADILKQSGPPKTLCHTDAHGWNLMQGSRLILIDWEGMRLAPVEADLFMFAGKTYWDIFFERYSNLRQGYMPDPLAMRFYTLRRKLEDIWAFMERILYDDMPGEQRMKALKNLRAGCEHLNDAYF